MRVPKKGPDVDALLAWIILGLTLKCGRIAAGTPIVSSTSAIAIAIALPSPRYESKVAPFTKRCVDRQIREPKYCMFCEANMDTPSNTSNHSRKRTSKSPRRPCWQCRIADDILVCLRLCTDIPIGKKRKVHAHVSQTSMPSLVSLDQSLSGSADEESTCSVHMAERLSKLEQLFERFVCRKSSTNTTPSGLQSPPLIASGSGEKISKWCRLGLPSDVRSESSIGDGIVSSLCVAGKRPTDSSSSVHKHGIRHLRYKRLWTSKSAKNHLRYMTMPIDRWWLCCRHNATQILCLSHRTAG